MAFGGSPLHSPDAIAAFINAWYAWFRLARYFAKIGESGERSPTYA